MALTLLLLNCYEAYFPDTEPTIDNIGLSSESKIVDLNLSANCIGSVGWGDSRRLELLVSSVRLLDKVCPSASQWFTDQLNSGKVVFSGSDYEYYAHFDFVSRKLYITDNFYKLSEGHKAAIIAHEYRHSLQNLAKFIKRAIFIVISGEPHEGVVENEAYLFELRILKALHE